MPVMAVDNENQHQQTGDYRSIANNRAGGWRKLKRDR